MFAITFQLAGSILLSWMVLSRSKKDIIQACWVVINNMSMMKQVAFRQFKEKYISVFGFICITIGYLIQFLSLDGVINTWLLQYNPLNNVINLGELSATIINIMLLLIFSIMSTKCLAKYSCGKIISDDFQQYIPTNAMYIETSEDSISFRSQ